MIRILTFYYLSGEDEKDSRKRRSVAKAEGRCAVSMDLKNLIPSLNRKSVPVKRDEEHPFVLLQREMNRLFDGLLQGWEGVPVTDGLGAYNPRNDMTEDDKEFIISAELPGMSDKDIEVPLARDAVTITGEKKAEKEERKGNRYYSERSFGSFTRTIPIPRAINADKVQAEFKKGILTIRMPKTPEALKEARKITVEAK